MFNRYEDKIIGEYNGKLVHYDKKDGFAIEIIDTMCLIEPTVNEMKDLYKKFPKIINKQDKKEFKVLQSKR